MVIVIDGVGGNTVLEFVNVWVILCISFCLLLDSSRTVQKVVLMTMAKVHQYLNNWSAFFHSSA